MIFTLRAPPRSRVAQHDICGSDATPSACRPRNRIKGIGHIRPHHPTTLHPLFRAAGHQSRHGDVISKIPKQPLVGRPANERLFCIFVMCVPRRLWWPPAQKSGCSIVGWYSVMGPTACKRKIAPPPPRLVPSSSGAGGRWTGVTCVRPCILYSRGYMLGPDSDTYD